MRATIAWARANGVHIAARSGGHSCSCPTVEIAGLALAAGLGFAGRKLGLTCNNVKRLTIVTADGVVRTCDATRNVSCQYIAGWDPAAGQSGPAAAISWLRNTYAAMRPHASGRAYQDYADPELQRYGLAYFGSNYARLRRVKRLYDPKNVFRFAQSVVRAPG